jgi:hypothetical protein
MRPALRHPQVVDIPRYPLEEPGDIELPLPQLRDELDPADDDAGVSKPARKR